MVAAQISKNNAWKSLVISIEEGSGAISVIFKTLFEDMSEILEQIEKLNQSQGDVLRQARFGEYSEQL